jgi:hypothetical protein
MECVAVYGGEEKAKSKAFGSVMVHLRNVHHLRDDGVSDHETYGIESED